MSNQRGVSWVIWLLLCGVVVFAALHTLAPIHHRAGHSPPTLWSREAPPPAGARLLAEGKAPLRRPPPTESIPLFDLALREEPGLDVCAFDLDLSRGPRFELSLTEGPLGLEPLLSTLDLMFLAWVSHRYQINPHFLLGIMHAESAGDCSAVSVAGAQGCFQITDSFGAQQLMNSYPQRMADWYWARRRLNHPTHRPWPPQAQHEDYYPADLFIPPQTYFAELTYGGEWDETLERRARRKLRRLVDPVATEIVSDTFGPVAVSSVASFSFGAIGSALHFHWQGRLLEAQTLLWDQASEVFATPGNKALWMATGYNQGGPRSTRILASAGPVFMDRTREDVAAYARRVTDACVELEQGEDIGPVPISWHRFSDFMQELRWTYSAIPVRWEPLRAQIYKTWFAAGPMPLRDIPQVFNHMAALDRRLAVEEPILDFKLGWE